MELKKEIRYSRSEKGKATRKRWRQKNPNFYIKNTYGLSAEQYKNMEIAQNNRCAICNISFSGIKKVVDHNHRTGKVRALLCNNCNIGIGLFKENSLVVKNAVSYLEKYE